MNEDIENLKQKYNDLLANLAGDIENNSTEKFARRVDEVVSEVRALIRKSELE